ncbi:MAG: hypothetical protein H6659_19275 [Ardenticatenaceae bacterium]|nr:hypothetical protein [Ardenticatenaceae bacterium]MCB8988576.1 hypothetical protein [Ardenticatenaceae bacterium]
MRNEVEIMRVLRMPPLGKLVVEINDQRYENISEITDNKLRQRALAAIGELITFVGGYQNLVDVGLAPAIAPPAVTSGEPEETPTSPELARQREAFLAQLEAQQNEMSGQPARGGFRLFNRSETAANAEPLVDFTETGDVKPRVEPAKQPTIAEQIDAILQQLVSADPKLSSQSIHLRQDPVGGLRIEVNGKIYEKPTDIPDKDVQTLIKTAVKEWNAS